MLDLPIQDGLTAAVQVVKFLLGDRVIDVHGRHTQFASLRQLVQPRRKEKTKFIRTNYSMALCETNNL